MSFLILTTALLMTSVAWTKASPPASDATSDVSNCRRRCDVCSALLHEISDGISAVDPLPTEQWIPSTSTAHVTGRRVDRLRQGVGDLLHAAAMKLLPQDWRGDAPEEHVDDRNATEAWIQRGVDWTLASTTIEERERAACRPLAHEQSRLMSWLGASAACTLSRLWGSMPRMSAEQLLQQAVGRVQQRYRFPTDGRWKLNFAGRAGTPTAPADPQVTALLNDAFGQESDTEESNRWAAAVALLRWARISPMPAPSSRDHLSSWDASVHAVLTSEIFATSLCNATRWCRASGGAGCADEVLGTTWLGGTPTPVASLDIVPVATRFRDEYIRGAVAQEWRICTTRGFGLTPADYALYASAPLGGDTPLPVAVISRPDLYRPSHVSDLCRHQTTRRYRPPAHAERSGGSNMRPDVWYHATNTVRLIEHALKDIVVRSDANGPGSQQLVFGIEFDIRMPQRKRGSGNVSLEPMLSHNEPWFFEKPPPLSVLMMAVLRLVQVQQVRVVLKFDCKEQEAMSAVAGGTIPAVEALRAYHPLRAPPGNGTVELWGNADFVFAQDGRSSDQSGFERAFPSPVNCALQSAAYFDVLSVGLYRRSTSHPYGTSDVAAMRVFFDALRSVATEQKALNDMPKAVTLALRLRLFRDSTEGRSSVSEMLVEANHAIRAASNQTVGEGPPTQVEHTAFLTVWRGRMESISNEDAAWLRHSFQGCTVDRT